MKAYQQGYKLFITDAILCDTNENIYYDYITDLYTKRKEYKKKLKC